MKQTIKDLKTVPAILIAIALMIFLNVNYVNGQQYPNHNKYEQYNEWKSIIDNLCQVKTYNFQALIYWGGEIYDDTGLSENNTSCNNCHSQQNLLLPDVGLDFGQGGVTINGVRVENPFNREDLKPDLPKFSNGNLINTPSGITTSSLLDVLLLHLGNHSMETQSSDSVGLDVHNIIVENAMKSTFHQNFCYTAFGGVEMRVQHFQAAILAYQLNEIYTFSDSKFERYKRGEYQLTPSELRGYQTILLKCENNGCHPENGYFKGDKFGMMVLKNNKDTVMVQPRYIWQTFIKGQHFGWNGGNDDAYKYKRPALKKHIKNEQIEGVDLSDVISFIKCLPPSNKK